MDLKGKRIILGSNSPRRRELLAGLNIDFEVDTGNDFDERFSPDTPYDEVPRLMSVGKSHGFHRPLAEDEILITADTMVILPQTEDRPGEILGKPKDREDAVRMLQLLPYPAHIGTRVDPDIFDGIARFHQNKRCFVDYDKGFFRKISRVPLLPIQDLQGEACNSAAMKKKLARFHVRKAKTSRS